jgi:hypothetical protein
MRADSYETKKKNHTRCAAVNHFSIHRTCWARCLHSVSEIAEIAHRCVPHNRWALEDIDWATGHGVICEDHG